MEVMMSNTPRLVLIEGVYDNARFAHITGVGVGFCAVCVFYSNVSEARVFFDLVSGEDVLSDEVVGLQVVDDDGWRVFDGVVLETGDLPAIEDPESAAAVSADSEWGNYFWRFPVESCRVSSPTWIRN